MTSLLASEASYLHVVDAEQLLKEVTIQSEV
jgi:hypothetical protein